jgi:hypothetical protein
MALTARHEDHSGAARLAPRPRRAAVAPPVLSRRSSQREGDLSTPHDTSTVGAINEFVLLVFTALTVAAAQKTPVCGELSRGPISEGERESERWPETKEYHPARRPPPHRSSGGLFAIYGLSAASSVFVERREGCTGSADLGDRLSLLS